MEHANGTVSLDDLGLPKPINPEATIELRSNSIEKAVKPAIEEVRGLNLVFIMVGLCMSIFLASTDETIVATALGSIINDFGSGDAITWIAAAYLLLMTAFQPLYGKFSDIFGRKAMIMFALSTFLIGSIGCGVAPNLVTLIVFRAITGIGAGGVISLAFIVISDVVPMTKRSIYQGFISATFALANVAGPLLGGVLTQYLSWRWVFYISIPIVIFAMALIIFMLPPLKHNESNFREMIKRIDGYGTLVLVFGTLLLILGLNWGGRAYPWSSPQVIVCLILGLVLYIVFAYIEKKVAVEPLIPASIFTRNSILASINGFMYCVTYFSIIYYWPLFHQNVRNASPLDAGLELLPCLLAISISAASSGFIVSKYKTYRNFMRAGAFLILLGVCLMALLRQDITQAELIIIPVLASIGLGFNFQLAITCGQLAVPPSDAAIITSFISFSQALGCVFGVAILGSIYNNVLISSLNSLLPDQDVLQLLSQYSSPFNTPIDIQPLVIQGYAKTFKIMFLSLIPFATVSFLTTLALEDIPLQDYSEKADTEPKPEPISEV